MQTENRGIPRSIVITRQPTTDTSWWANAKTREDFMARWKKRVPLMKLTKATAFASDKSGIELAE